MEHEDYRFSFLEVHELRRQLGLLGLEEAQLLQLLRAQRTALRLLLA